MRLRALDASGDMRFGHGMADFLVDSPALVAQRATTRMRLWLADWFLDMTDGTPYRTAVLGMRTAATRDAALRSRILGTPGVTGIASYASQVDRAARTFSVQVKINTRFGQILVATAVDIPNGDVRYVR